MIALLPGTYYHCYMVSFYEMLRKISSSKTYHSMVRFVKPLDEHFGINHFWYYRITPSGHYCYLGSHAPWSEYCFDKSLVNFFPCLRHPKTLQSGIFLMKASDDPFYQDVIRIAWNKFNINFNLNMQKKTEDGSIEAFGFGSRFNDCKADERLLNELNLLRSFVQHFRQKFSNLFHILEDNQVDLAAKFGAPFFEQPKSMVLPLERALFARKTGMIPFEKLTPRELEVLKFLSWGYPASYIAKELQLSTRTIENYLATIKAKLGCATKIELIQKAQILNLSH